MYRQQDGRIWLIGGTGESRELACAIAQSHLPCTISVTSEAAKKMYPLAPELSLRVARFTEDTLIQFLQQENIIAVVDASHPFAVEISRLAIAITTQQHIPYLRYERPDINPHTGCNLTGCDATAIERSTVAGTVHPIQLESFDDLLAGEWLRSQRVLLAIGYQPLPRFRCWQTQATLFARILPSPIALETALNAGFAPDRLIALRPPISCDLERALWQQWRLSLVVTKASGTGGGEHIKRQLAAELGIPLVIIARPKIEYPKKTSEIANAIAFCRQHLFSGFNA